MSEDRSIDPGAREIEELNRQLAELRAENGRLRELLGVGTRDEAVSPWEPTLFVDDGPLEEVTATAVDRHSPRGEGRSVPFAFRRSGRRSCAALGELSNGEGGLEPRCPRRLGQRQEARPGISAIFQ